ncbi:MAG: tetratricopeptide repeat protein [Acidobacteria bacterium]|nr:tetratricopeptide repeat protein [Acidobacteriota bacterium]
MRHFSWFGLTLLVASLAGFTACSRDPNVRKEKYYESGERYFAKGKFREAIIQFRNATEVDANFAAAHYELAKSYLELREWRQAYAELSRTLELDPDNFKAHIDIANLLIANGQLDGAREHTDLLRDKQASNPDAHVAIAHLCEAEHKLDLAVTELEKAISLAPQRGDLYLDLAVLETKAKLPDAAELDFKKAVDLKASGNPRIVLAAFYESRGRYSNAEQEVQAAISANPKDMEARAALAKLYLAQGKRAEAEDFLKQLKREMPQNPMAYRMLGDFYVAVNNIDAALSEYASLYRDHPRDLEVEKNYVQLLIVKSRWDEANKINEEILKYRPQDENALLYRGEIELGLGKANDAVQTLQDVASDNPDNAVAHYQLGRALSEISDWDRAQQEWQEAARLQPTLIDAQRSLANVALERGDFAQLNSAATSMIAAAPASPEGYALRALGLMNQKEFTIAAQAARKAIEVAPQSAVGYLEMGNLRAFEHKWNEAEKWYKQSLSRDPNSLEALRGLATSYLAERHPEKAVAAVQEQIAISPNTAFYTLLGGVLVDNKNYHEARTALTKAVELDKHNTEAYAKLCQVEAAAGALDDAISTGKRAVSDNPKVADLFILLGTLYERKADFEQAKGAYQNALEVRHNDPKASNNLAYLLLETHGNADEALQLAQAARRAMPKSSIVADTLGWAFYQKGVYQSAIDLFHDAINLAHKNKEPENATYHYHLGMAYAKVAQPTLAKQELDTVLKIDPKYSQADGIRKQLAD